MGNLDLCDLSLTKGAGLKTVREILELRELVLGEETQNDKGYVDYRGSYRPNHEKSWYPPMIQKQNPNYRPGSLENITARSKDTITSRTPPSSSDSTSTQGKRTHKPEENHVKDHQYPLAVQRLMEALRLQGNAGGLYELLRIMRIPEVTGTRIEDGEYEGCLDRDRIHREILPGILREQPLLRTFLERKDMMENEVDFTTLAIWTESFHERFLLLNGDRPLPSHHNVPVKNILHIYSKCEPGPEFGFLSWLDKGCRVSVTAEEGRGRGQYLTLREIEYPTTWDAFAAGWNVD